MDEAKYILDGHFKAGLVRMVRFQGEWHHVSDKRKPSIENGALHCVLEVWGYPGEPVRLVPVMIGLQVLEAEFQEIAA